MQHFEFEYPYAFLLLLLIICIYKCPLSIKKIIFPHTTLFSQKAHWFNREKLLYSIIFTLLVTALASPISYDSKNAQQRKGRDLVFVLDTSGSMEESDYSAENRQASKFSILQNLIKTFVTKRFDDNVGVSVFGSFAFNVVPITYDMHSLVYMLNFLEVGMAGNSTAIGDGLQRALEMLQKSNARNKVIILITDGYQNSGVTKIKDAVALAKKMNVKIYTIGVGKKSDYDAKLLERIAKDTDARSFEAADAAALQNVYKELDNLEPSAIRSQHYLNRQVLFTYPLAFAILLLLYLLAKRRS
ncbi:vWA domain-containing protein [Sulfurimonas paralvinellae]|uniref:VWA domain-containing protein n=1 Tax=Sulfurimonas paralvinellae TaxID=317658 RepID=A0A7M1B8X8_9BACT|nr:VWA domain-containing protein [Sulfurimonas paralvinellae]QOP46179.1 VWA domain-containing protein [Sulfurimonas paralvinellae]